MAGLVEFLQVVAEVTADGLQKAADVGVKIGGQVGTGMLRGLGNIEQRIADKFRAAGDAATDALAKALPFSLGMMITQAVEKLAEKLKEITVHLIETAAEVQRVGIEFDSIFGKAGDSLDKFLIKSAPFYGTTVLALRDMAANLGAMAVGFGMSRDSAAGFTERIVKLTGDIATFKGQKFDDTLHAVEGALVGITRPMHMLGVMITEARIEQEALRETGKKHKDELTQQEKAVAALTVMYQLATPMMGSAERQQGSLNLMWQQTKAAVGNVSNSVSQDMIPALSEFLGWLKKQDWVSTAADKSLRVLGTVVEGLIDLFVAAIEGTKSIYHAWDFMISGMIDGVAKLMEKLPWTDHAYWEGVAKNASDGMDKAAAAMLASNAKFMAQLGKPFDLFGDPYKLPKHAPGPMAPPGSDTPNDPKELDKAVALIREGAKHENTRAEALKRSHDLQVKIEKMLKDGVKDYEDQVHLEKLLHELRQSDADAHTEALKNRHEEVSAMDKTEDKLRAIRQLKKDVNAQKALATTEEETKEWDKLLKQINSDLNAFSLPEQFANAYEDAITGTEKWSDALTELANNGKLVNTIMGSLGKGAAKSMLTELRDIAHAKAIQNIAQGIEWIGHGIWDAAHFNPQAGAEFAAAGQAFASAAEWGLLAGAAGGGFGGHGGGSAASAPGQTGGNTTGSTTSLPQQTIIYLDPLDPDNVRAHQVVGGIVQQAIERGVLVIQPTSAAPASVRGNV